MKKVNEVVIDLFIATDQQNWSAVENSFADRVLLDYSSMNGAPATALTPDEIINAWKKVLPGFEHTHHQVGNFVTSVNDNQATVFCYGTASHYLTDTQGNVWTVVGSYNFDLSQDNEENWHITGMTFNFKYQDGNTMLPEKAMNHVKLKK